MEGCLEIGQTENDFKHFSVKLVHVLCLYLDQFRAAEGV